MNNNELIKKLRSSYIAGEGVIFIKTDDFPRAISIINTSFSDKVGSTYSLTRQFYDEGDWESDSIGEHNSFHSLILSSGSMEEDILVLNNVQGKIDDSVADTLLHYSSYGSDTFLIFIVPLDYILPRELDRVNIYELSPPGSSEIEQELFSIFENKTRLFSKLNLTELINSMLGLPLYKIQNFLKYELSENEDQIKSRGEKYLIEQLQEERYSHINNIQGLSILKTNNVQIAGNENIKEEIRTLKQINDVNKKGYNLKKPKGILLHGSRGVAKTQFAKYIANQFNNELIKIDLSGIYNKWLGVPEERLNTIISFIDNIGNCTVLIDEIHLLFDTESKAEDTTNRLLNTLLTYMSENDNGVFFVFTANDISKLPPALIRKGRLDQVIEIPLPDSHTRALIAKQYLDKHDVEINDLGGFVSVTEGCNGADIEWYVERGVLRSVTEEIALTDNFLASMVNS